MPLTRILTFSVTRTPKTALFKPAHRAPVDSLTSVRAILLHQKLSMRMKETLTREELRTLSKVASSVLTPRRTMGASASVGFHQAQLVYSVRTGPTTNAATTTA